jgi:NADH-quinone oxidoreductase subunit A
VGSLVRYRSGDERQKIAYECGMEPVGTPYVPMDIRFYLFALLFVIFDVESLFLYPWAVSFRELGLFGLIDMTIFIGILFFGLIYTWKRGALRWES